MGDLVSIPGLGRSPGERKGYPFQYSGLENSMDCIVHGITKSRTWLSDFHFTSLHCVVLKPFGEENTIIIHFIYGKYYYYPFYIWNSKNYLEISLHFSLLIKIFIKLRTRHGIILINPFALVFIFSSERLSLTHTLKKPESNSWWSSAYLAGLNLQYPIINPCVTWQVWIIGGCTKRMETILERVPPVLS